FGGDRGGFGGGGGGFRGGGGGGGFSGGAGGGGFRGGGGGGGGGMPPQVVGEAKGIVKFFNGQKGFGFIVRDDGGEDVFVHISAVEQAGLTGLAEGQPLEFTLVDRGGRISATDLKIDGEPMPVEDRGPPRDRDAGGFGGAPRGGPGGAPQRQLTGEKATGTVKFFNATKGFGFITRDDGQPDAFVHISAMQRANIPSLQEGDRLEFELEVDRRGKTAAVNLSALQ
ncbi:MAG TPA: cold-shock protein, partial [Allosphingosinicella sp.]|nr:cold-shock protein [Allosphingosinicella sp.]